MLGVCISYLRDAFSHNQWDYILTNLGADRIYLLVPEDRESDIITSKVLGAADLVRSAAELPDDPLVVLSPVNARYLPGKVSLAEFEHPESCTYLFGSEHVNLSEDELGSRRPDHLVYIPTLTHDELYSWQACAIALWDRRLKCG